MNWLGKFYQWLWFHLEFWLTPVDRRPLTYIMRDWIYKHLNIFGGLVALFVAGVVILSVWHGTTSTIASLLGGLLVAHLVWGSKWIEKQQEYPEYLGD